MENPLIQIFIYQEKRSRTKWKADRTHKYGAKAQTLQLQRHEWAKIPIMV